MKHSLFKAIWPPSVFGNFVDTFSPSIGDPGSDVNGDGDGHTEISRDF